jgi:UDP-N-acetyl-D-galactosamine dehydrogenase
MLDPGKRLGVIGLGYVGLPLAVAFAGHRQVVGFDLDPDRIEELRAGRDRTGEVSSESLSNLPQLAFTDDESDLMGLDVYIVTVPTPIDRQKTPDLGPLLSASELVGRFIQPGCLVVFESTVYPGATEEECVPRIEKHSGLKLNSDFFCGYSPERINPGDETHKLSNIVKVTSGSSPQAAEMVDDLYNEIIDVGTYKASSIKIAEAEKVIENTQRDVNIALVNELAIIFERLDIDTEEVLKAAETKWNFLSFRPGLVGGHCIGVDPYYLTHKAESVGYQPEVILSGRRLNDRMGEYVAARLIKTLVQRDIVLADARVLVLGYTFKENCSDTRNTKVVNIIDELSEYGISVDVFDPWVKDQPIEFSISANFLSSIDTNTYDGIVIAVAHKVFADMGVESIRSLGKENHVLFDLKYIFKNEQTDLRL